MSTVNEIVARLERASVAYYNGEPVMTDAAFDVLVAELRALNPQHPFLASVGAPVTSGWNFRDAELRAAVEAAGGAYKEGFSRKITVLVMAEPGSMSHKAGEARQAGITVMGREEMRKLLNAEKN